MNFKPVIFLAFANDKVDQAQYLRNLSTEMHGIRRALEEAVNSGLCEVIERSSASVRDILDVFQNPNYGPRVSIFHYGGHADGFSLLLESEDGSKTMTHKEGLVPFLARQVNLKLIFLNGCSSEGQTNDLLNAGIPAVVGTTSSINDEIATMLATRFYSSLGAGSGIEKAWTDATDEVKIHKGTGNTRALLWEGKKEVSDRFPWVIQFRPGAGIIRGWNLPDISGNPLYGLPDIPQTYNLPESPFLYLNRYERRHAEVFFGRSYYIRTLFSSVNDRQAPPIILLYGQSGVGKSSLLEAGLQPRLESQYEIIYLRRIGSLGLSGTLFNALLEKNGFTPEVNAIQTIPKDSKKIIDDLRSIASNVKDTYKADIQQLIDKISGSDAAVPDNKESQVSPPSTISEAWKLLEDKLKKPLIIILDQLEEAYTRPNERLGNEMNTLFIDLKSIYGDPLNIPKGKIILSFRKEYHPEIDEYCKNYELPRSKVFIEHISKDNVLEVFKGFKETPRLQARYHLQIEDGLPEIVAADIGADEDAPIAPMLQILLTKMWIKAISIRPEMPAFTHDVYRLLKEAGLAMDEFLQNQLQTIKDSAPVAYQNGFVLDVLNYYCTPNSTAAARTLDQLNRTYPSAKEDAAVILKLCTEQSLITDLGGTELNAMLAHDTLAKSVSKLYQGSTKPLQQAKRVLSSRMEAVQGGSNKSTLDFWDLNLIDSVKKFMPAMTEQEMNLIDISRKEVVKKEKDKKVLKYVKRALAAITLAGAIAIGILYKQSEKHAKESTINHLAAASTSILPRDPTQSLVDATQGMAYEEEKSNVEIKKSLTKAFYSALNSHTPWYRTVIKSELNYTDLLSDDKAKRIIPYTESALLKIYDFEGIEKGSILVDSTYQLADTTIHDIYHYFSIVQWTHDGSSIVTLSNIGSIMIFSADGAVKKSVRDTQYYLGLDVSPVSNELIALSGTGYHIDILSLDGKLKKSIAVDPDVTEIKYIADGKNILLGKGDFIDENGEVHPGQSKMNTIGILNIESEKLISIQAKAGDIERITPSPKGNYISTEHRDNSVSIWDKKAKLIQNIPLPYPSLNPLLNEIVWIEFHPMDKVLAVCYRDHNAYIYQTDHRAPPVILKHDLLVTFANFSSNGEQILTGSADNTAAVWDLAGNRLFTLMGHQNDVTGGKILDDERVMTTSLDGTLRTWQLENYDDIVLKGHQGKVKYLDIDPQEKYLVSAGIDDHTMRLWDLTTKREVHKILVDNQGIRYVQFINDHEVLGITDINEAFIYTLFNDKPVILKGHNAPIEWGECLFDHIITASRDGTIRFWNKNGKVEKVIQLESGGLMSLRISEADSLVAVGSDSGSIFLYNPLGDFKGKLLGHRGAVNYLDISKDGLHMVSASNDRTGIIWNLKTKKAEGNLDRIACAPYNVDCNVISANFSYDGTHVVTTSSDRAVRVWDLHGDLKGQMVGHVDALVDAYFSPNDLMVYSFSNDRTLRLWDQNGKEIATYRGHTAKINMAAMDKDINHIYTASDDGTIRIWLTPVGVYHWIKQNKQFQSITHSEVH